MKLTNFLKNILLGECSVIVKLLMQFVVRTVFLRQLAIEYLGASDLFATIVSVLAVGQMGFGNAMKYAMYKPIAQDDHRQVKAISDFYRRVYRRIGLTLTVIGFLVYPVLLASREAEMSLRGMAPAYVFLMLDMLVTHLYKDKRDVLVASQKEYISMMGETLATLLLGTLQILALAVFHSFMLYFVGKLIGSIFLLCWLQYQSRRFHPYLRDKEKIPLEPGVWREVRRNMKANMLTTVGTTINDNMDYLLTFFTGGLGQVGILTNYKLIINSVTQFVEPLFYSALGTVGHLGATEEKTVLRDHFYVFQMLCFWCFGFSAVALLCLTNPFVALWAGKDYLTGSTTVCVMVAVFFTRGVAVVTGLFRDALGLFWENRYRKITESLLNLVLSILMVRPLGVLGLFLGTLISHMCVTFWVDPYNLFRHGFGVGVTPYFKRYAAYTLILALAGAATMLLCKTTESLPDLASFLLKMVICTIVPNIVLFLSLRRTPEFAFLVKYTESIFPHSLRKK